MAPDRPTVRAVAKSLVSLVGGRAVVTRNLAGSCTASDKASPSEFDFSPFLECGSALLCRFCFSVFPGECGSGFPPPLVLFLFFLGSAAVLCSAALVSQVFPLVFTPPGKTEKTKAAEQSTAALQKRAEVELSGGANRGRVQLLG